MKSTVETKISELVKLGHERADELKAACGAVDVRSVAQLISDLASQLEVQFARSNALAAENAGLKSIQEWAVAGVFKSGAKEFESTKAAGFDTDDCLHDAVLVMLSELKTPTTNAFLAEVRASCVDAVKQKISDAISGCYQDEMAGLDTAVNIASEFAAQLRKGVQS